MPQMEHDRSPNPAATPSPARSRRLGKQAAEAEAAAPDALKEALAESGLDPDEATPLLIAAVKAMTAHKATGGK